MIIKHMKFTAGDFNLSVESLIQPNCWKLETKFHKTFYQFCINGFTGGVHKRTFLIISDEII